MLGLSLYAVAAQAVGLVGMGLNFLARALTSDLHLKTASLVASAVWAVHFAMLHAWVGASNNLLQIVILVASFWTLPLPARVGLAFLPVLPAPWIVRDAIDVLPIIGAVVFCLAMMCLRGIPLRVALLACSAVWLVYDAANGSIAGILTEAVSIVIVASTILRLVSAGKGPPVEP